MTGTLRVTPRELINASQEFQSSSQNVTCITDPMLSVIRNTCTAWQGDASSTYLRKFNSLSDDMQRMYNKIREHSTDLNEMARNYTSAEDRNISSYSSFQENPIS